MKKARESEMPRSWEIFFHILILWKIWRKVPDLRLGQLIQNLGDVYYLEDSKLFEELRKKSYIDGQNGYSFRRKIDGKIVDDSIYENPNYKRLKQFYRSKFTELLESLRMDEFTGKYPPLEKCHSDQAFRLGQKYGRNDLIQEINKSIDNILK